MPGTLCAVAACKNSYKITVNDPHKSHVKYHQFPRNNKVSDVWKQRCRRADNINVKYARVCSEHFLKEDYHRDLKGELLGTKIRLVLKEEAIPSVGLTTNHGDKENDSERYSRMQVRERKQVVRELLQSTPKRVSVLGNASILDNEQSSLIAPISDQIDNSSLNTEESQDTSIPSFSNDSTPTEGSSIETTTSLISVDLSLIESAEACVTKNISSLTPKKCNCRKLEEELDLVKKEKKDLEKHYSALKFQSIRKDEKLEDLKQEHAKKCVTFNSLKRELKRLQQRKVPIKDLRKNALLTMQTVFTKNQVDMMFGKKKRVVWTNEELSTAFTLRYFSKRCYLYLKNELNFPLPGISTLQRYASKITMTEGTLKDVLRIMKTASENLTEKEKLTVLNFDEVKCKKTYEYDVKRDCVVGPHSQLQVVMVRGLVGNWKQPIYFKFDQKMTKSILLSLISELDSVGYQVVACTCDMGGSNMGLWRELGVSTSRTWFSLPGKTDYTDRKIFFFADVPHLLKLLRNWLLDTGFVLYDGEVISKEPLEALVELDKHEIKACHRLTLAHLKCVKSQRQNVRLAAELISNTVAQALKRFKPGVNAEIAINTAKFLETANNWFDIMNTRVKDSPGCATKSAYGISEHFEEQLRCLKEMEDLINNMTCIGKTCMQMFQKGILISTKSLQLLYWEVKREKNVEYILTHRLNQDCLENYFSQLRSRGCLDDHPTPLNALYRMRLVMIGRNPGMVKRNSNTDGNDKATFIVADVLKDIEANLNDIAPVTGDASNSLINSEEISLDDNEISTEEEEMCFNSTEQVGFELVSGWVAKKLKDKFPELKKDDLERDHTYHIPSYISQLSYGGLTEPSDYFLRHAKIIEDQFRQFHQDGVNRERGVIKSLSSFIHKKLPAFPLLVIECYIKVRTFIRIKFLIESLKTSGQSNDDESRKRSKKLKNTIT